MPFCVRIEKEKARNLICCDFAQQNFNIFDELLEAARLLDLCAMQFGAELPDPGRKQHATRSGGGNRHVSVSVRVS